MSKRAVFSVTVAGTNITTALLPVLIGLRVSDKVGTHMHLGEVGSELGLLELARRDVLVRLHHVPPRQQARDRLGRDRRDVALALFRPGQFAVLRAQDRVAHLADFLGALAGAHRLQQPPHRIQRALGVVVGELAVMGELVAHIDQLVDDRAMRAVQHVAENIVPQALHDLQQLLGVEAELAVRLRPPLGKARDHLLRPAFAHRGLQPLHHEGLQALGQKLHALENCLACTLCHALTPQISSAVWRFKSSTRIVAARRVRSLPRKIILRIAGGSAPPPPRRSAPAHRQGAHSVLSFGPACARAACRSWAGPDRGGPMKAKTTALLLTDLGVLKSHSRPHTSNDNPFSEAHFKTLKYQPEFPRNFENIEQARAFCRRFFPWYNEEHHHAGIGLMTPDQIHFGQAEAIHTARQATLDAAYQGTPERFVRKPPQPPKIPTAVWINPPKPTEGNQA